MFGKISAVYQIVNNVNGKRYIGSAVDINTRWRNHVVSLNANKHHSKYLQRSWNKYGKDCFSFLILEGCEKELLIEREQYYIDTLKPEYNICRKAGSTLGKYHTEEAIAKMKSRKFSEETRRKMSESAKKKKLSEEHKKNIGIAGLGRSPSKDTREKMSAWQVGRVLSDETRKKIGSRVLSKETKEKMSAARRAWWERIKENGIKIIRSKEWTEKMSALMKGNQYGKFGKGVKHNKKK